MTIQQTPQLLYPGNLHEKVQLLATLWKSVQKARETGQSKGIILTTALFYTIGGFTIILISSFDRANTGPVTGTSYTVKNLPTGKEFQFRIIPVNLAGEGEPSEPTENVKVQPPPSAFRYFQPRLHTY